MSEQFYWGLITINTIFLVYEFTKNIAFKYGINNIKKELEANATKLGDAERRYGKIINQLRDEIRTLKGNKS
tara:strand:- start:580 stop:795 length:216 start_codon:yes stop_codon:yes gene_type:complete